MALGAWMGLVDTRATGFCLGDRLGRLSNGPGLRGLAAGVLATPAERAQHRMKERRLTKAAWCCAAVWLGSAVLVHAFAYPLWFERPLSLIAREFDYFAGLASTNGNAFLIGRWLMAALFVLWGLAHVRLAAWMERGAWTSGQAHLLLGAGALACLAGLPLLSPDVFYYLAKGWIESGYGMDAYAVAIRDVPGHEADPMFANVYAGFKNHAGNYGPAFQMLCAWVTGVGGGGAYCFAARFQARLRFGLCSVCMDGGSIGSSTGGQFSVLPLCRSPSAALYFSH